VIYFVGTYENFRFTPTSEGVLDYAQLYAPLSTLDDQGRRVLIGWLRETRSAREMERAGWSGVQSIPRVLGVDGAGRLTMTPIPEIEKIRGAHHHFSAEAVKAHFTELALDIEAEFTPSATGEYGLSLVYQPQAKERVEFAYNPASQQLAVRHVLIDQYGLAKAQTQAMPHELAPGEALELRVFLDGSAIEMIANGRTSLTTRVYPLGHVEISVEMLGAKESLRALNIWEMPSIWR
jgi:beta-fructofuranosidase